MTIKEEKEQLLEMMVKLGRLSGTILDLDNLYWSDLDNEPIFYLNSMEFIKNDKGWISNALFDIPIPDDSIEFDIDYEKNEYNHCFRTEKRPVITEPTNDLEKLFTETFNARLSHITEWFFNIYNRKKELKRRLERVDELEGKYKLDRENKTKFIIYSSENLDKTENTIIRLLEK